ncbi:MAG: SMI1/KNR4 family protein [Chloroflexota bacterium]
MNPRCSSRLLIVAALGLLLGGCSALSAAGVDLAPGLLPAQPGAAPATAGPLDLDAVTIIGGRAWPVPPAEVDALERELGVRMPAGYREYMARLGGGYLCDTLEVYSPDTLRTMLPLHRGIMAASWSWKPGKVPFGQDDAIASIPVAEDGSYDMIAYSPGDPDHLFVLPRDTDQVLVSDGGLLDLAGAMCRGELHDGPAAATATFVGLEPYDVPTDSGRPAPIPPDLPPADLARSPREVLDAYLAELTAVEAWAIEQAGPDVLRGALVSPRLQQALDDQLVRRLEGIHERYASPLLVPMLGILIPWDVPPLHSRFRVTTEQAVSADRVRFLVVEADGERIWWTFERGADGWRLIKLTPEAYAES